MTTTTTTMGQIEPQSFQRMEATLPGNYFGARKWPCRWAANTNMLCCVVCRRRRPGRPRHRRRRPELCAWQTRHPAGCRRHDTLLVYLCIPLGCSMKTKRGHHENQDANGRPLAGLEKLFDCPAGLFALAPRWRPPSTASKRAEKDEPGGPFGEQSLSSWSSFSAHTAIVLA